MQSLVGIIRTEAELRKALDELSQLKQRVAALKVTGHRQYNPGWHLALDLQSMLTVAEATTLAALERRESRGAQTRGDYPSADPEFGKVNVVVRERAGETSITQEPLPTMPAELKSLLED